VYSSTVDGYNTAVGSQSLQLNVSGTSNVADGYQRLANNTASGNTALGYSALGANHQAITTPQ
jgi:hypothetical protein